MPERAQQPSIAFALSQSPSVLAVYQQVPELLRNKFESSQASVFRLTDPKFNEWVELNGFRENDLEHVCDMLAYVNEIEDSSWHLATEVNLNDVRFMIILHDAGENYTGDVPTCGPVRNSLEGSRRKLAEPAYAILKVIARIPDEGLKRKAEELYCRYIAQDPTDKEALLAKYIDRASGTCRVNAPNVFANWRLKNGLAGPPDDLREHVAFTEERLIHQAYKFVRTLGPGAKAEFFQSYHNDLAQLRAAGY